MGNLYALRRGGVTQLSGVSCTVGVRVLPLLGAVCWDREVHFEVGIHASHPLPLFLLHILYLP